MMQGDGGYCAHRMCKDVNVKQKHKHPKGSVTPGIIYCSIAPEVNAAKKIMPCTSAPVTGLPSLNKWKLETRLNCFHHKIFLRKSKHPTASALVAFLLMRIIHDLHIYIYVCFCCR